MGTSLNRALLLYRVAAKHQADEVDGRDVPVLTSEDPLGESDQDLADFLATDLDVGMYRGYSDLMELHGLVDAQDYRTLEHSLVFPEPLAENSCLGSLMVPRPELEELVDELE